MKSSVMIGRDARRAESQNEDLFFSELLTSGTLKLEDT
jgi:hypothetical protein